MNAIKTTINDWKKAPAKSTLKHDSCTNSKCCAAEKVDALYSPNSPGSWRSVRQIIITCGDMKSATMAERRAALCRLVRAARRWLKAYDSVVRWVAFPTNFGMEQRSNDYVAAAAVNSKTGEIKL